MSKTLIKLVDAALLPAALMIIAKVGGLFLVNSIFNLNWGIDQTLSQQQLFSVRFLYTDPNAITTATSYSNLIMFVAVIIGFLVKVIQTKYFQETNINPRLYTKLAENNLLNLVKSSFEIYHEGTIWLAFAWISWLLMLVGSVLSINYQWMTLGSFFLLAFLTTLFLREVNNEFEEHKKNLKF